MTLKIKSIIFILCLVYYANTMAQPVKFIKNPLTAKYRIYITQKPIEATIFVYKVKKYEDALGAGLWYIVENPMIFREAMTVFEVKKKEDADLIVYYTNDRNKAGYKLKN
jgi:hypothetical protein